MKRNPLSAVIVAAGMGKRMGSFKPLLPLGGSCFLERILTTLRQGGTDEIIIVTGHEAHALTEKFTAPDIMFVHNPHYATSDMLASVRLGLEQVTGAMVFITPVDAPLFAAESLRAMLAAFMPPDVIIPSYRGEDGHPVLLAAAHIPAILAYDGKEGLRGALASLAARIIRLELPDPGLIMDADTPEDYEKMLRYHP